MIIEVSKPDAHISGTITLAGSKSISNRALIIRALCTEPFEITGLANAKDTDLLQALLASDEPVRDAGAAGTTYRFMTAYLALQPGEQILTGSERMKQRPIKVLVDALRTLGASIEYMENEGYPPLKIGTLDVEKAASELSPFSISATSMGLAGSFNVAPGAATCRRPTMLRPTTVSRAIGLAPMCGPNCSCSTWSRYACWVTTQV